MAGRIQEDPTAGARSAGGSASASASASSGPSLCTVDAECDNQLFCDGVERCDPGAPGADRSGCVAGEPPCPGACDEMSDACLSDCDVDDDADDDGVAAIACGGTDCDDGNSMIYPGAQEVCDPLDVDEDCDPQTFGGLDSDKDGLISDQCCNHAEGVAYCGDDCDDSQVGYGVGDWAHCGACGNSCGSNHACVEGACVDARRVFMTSTIHRADFGGLAQGDAICQARATEAGLGGTFMALLVAPGPGKGLDRLEHPEVPFVRLDGVTIADGWGDLVDGSIAVPLNLDEQRKSSGGWAWTGLWKPENLISSCAGWTSTSECNGQNVKDSECGGGGVVDAIDTLWDGEFVYHCSSEHHLYCIEQ